MQSLKNMNVDISCDFVLTHMLLSRLDPETARAFEREHGSTSIPEYMILFDFLERHCNGLSNVAGGNSNQKPILKNKPVLSGKASNSFLARQDVKRPQCLVCSDNNHPIYTCSQYIKKTPNERYAFCKSHNLCFACLSGMHVLNKCKSISSCRKCGSKKHHTTLHFEKENVQFPTSENANELIIRNQNRNEMIIPDPGSLISPTSMPSVENSFTACAPQQSRVVLRTAIVEMQTNDGSFKECRALLDSGSEISIISQKCFNALNISKVVSSSVINGIGNTQIPNKGIVQIFVRPVGISDVIFTVDAVILQKICSKIPASPLDHASWTYLHDLELADPQYFVPNEVNILLGADIFANLLANHLILGKDGGPNALRTIFGYVLLGKVDTKPVQLNAHSLNVTLSENNLDNTLRNFFEIETVPTIANVPDESECEIIFKKSFYRITSGRYVVPLPFKELNACFPESRTIALQRFLSLERRLLRQPALHQQYCAVI